MKNKKLIGLASLMLVLGAIGCKKDPETPQECEKHTWGETEVVTAATCTERGVGKRKCTVCGKEEDNVAIPALKHDYKDEATGGKEPTCTEDGYKVQKCSRCGETKNVTIPALDHDYKRDAEGYVAPTCTEKGSENLTCSRCGDKKTNVEIPALNHDYGEWETVTQPDCVNKGRKKQVCKVCGYENFDDIDPLGHDLKVIGDDEAEEGKALVRVYECNRCHDTYLGFKANEPSKDSENHLVIDDDGGARFWGRPIGNSLALTTDGSSASSTNGEIVYCKDETGDFFEYVFDLDPEQAAKLASCRLYCDAVPANYLSGDFWACDPSATEYTPGYYIDGADNHVQWEDDAENPGQQKKVMVKNHARVARGTTDAGAELDEMVPMGKRIEDYRYILYVDDNPVEFDKKTEVKVSGGTNQPRKEYELPYTFNLHTGENRISLRMAGGYRSVFYNFTFRPYTPPVDITVAATELTVKEGKTIQIENISETGVTFKSDKESVATVDENGLITGVKPGTANITISKEGNYRDAKIAVTVQEREGVVKVEAENSVFAPADGAEKRTSSYSGVTMVENIKKDTTLTAEFDSELAGKFNVILSARGSNINFADNLSITMNGNPVTVSGGVNNANSFEEAVAGLADLDVGKNTMVITCTAESSAIKLDYFKFTPHVHAFGDVTDVAAVDGGAMKHGEATCTCGAKRISLGALDGTFAAGSKNKDKDPVPPEGFLKLNGNGNSISYNFSAAAAGKATFAVEAVMDNFQGGNGSNNTRKLTDGKGNGKPYNITFKVDYKDGEEDKTNDVDMSGIAEKTYDELFDKVPEGQTPIMEKHSAITTFEIGTADVGAGMNTLTITRNGSYNFIIRTIYVIL